jgi:peptidoglycan/xylan/chitin deacetylase (PgdA/CDA1 family)
MNARLRTALTMADRFVPWRPGVTILIYHRVGGGTDSSVDLPVTQFCDQLDMLVASHSVISLDEATQRLRSPDSAVDPAVVITFDDGSSDFCEHALPALVERRLPVTLYLATAFVGGTLPWGVPAVTWDQLAAAQAAAGTSLEIGAHSHRHELFDSMSGERAASDLDACGQAIESHLGIGARHFAYPKAVTPSAAAETVVRRRYATAAVAGSRANLPGGDLHRLFRTPVQRHDSAATFAWKVRGGGRLDGTLRASRARWRSGFRRL